MMISPETHPMHEILERYIYMFAGLDLIGIDVPSGWIPVFSELCKRIDSILGVDKRGFRFTQIKTKFNDARWYWNMDELPGEVHSRSRVKISRFDASGQSVHINPSTQKLTSTRDHLDSLIEKAEHSVRGLCMICGQSGRSDVRDGIYLLLCDAHKNQRRIGQLPPDYFNPEEHE